MWRLLFLAGTAARLGPPPEEAIQLSSRPLVYRVPRALNSSDIAALRTLVERRIERVPSSTSNSPRQGETADWYRRKLQGILGTKTKRETFWVQADRDYGDGNGLLDSRELGLALQALDVSANYDPEEDPRFWPVGSREDFLQQDWASHLTAIFSTSPWLSDRHSETGWATEKDLAQPGLRSVVAKFGAAAGVANLLEVPLTTRDPEPPLHMEIQIVRYPEKGWYACHHDSSEDDASAWVGGRARVLTIFTSFGNFSGGETSFPGATRSGRVDWGEAEERCQRRAHCHEGVVVDPQESPGDIIFWWTRKVKDDEALAHDPSSIHAGCPVTAGEKWAVNVWVSAKRKRRKKGEL